MFGSPGNFNTGGIMFAKDSYEAYLEAVKKCMENPFIKGNSELFRVPPVYRESIIQYLKENFPQYEISTYELSGIWIGGDFNAYMKDAIRRVNDGYGLISDTKYIDDILVGLKKHFPNKVFEIQRNQDIYYGTGNQSYDKDGSSIVIDGFEISGKWQPVHFGGKIEKWMLDGIDEYIRQGRKTFITDHNEEMVEILRKKYPNRTFDIKYYAKVFYWDKRICKEYPTTTLIILDNFNVPVPKNK